MAAASPSARPITVPANGGHEQLLGGHPPAYELTVSFKLSLVWLFSSWSSNGTYQVSCSSKVYGRQMKPIKSLVVVQFMVNILNLPTVCCTLSAYDLWLLNV